LTVRQINRRTTVDEQTNGCGADSPGSGVQSSAVRGNVEVTVALNVERLHVDAQVEEKANTVGVAVGGESSQQSTA